MEEKGEGVGAKLDTHTREEVGASTAQRHTAGGGGGPAPTGRRQQPVVTQLRSSQVATRTGEARASNTWLPEPWFKRIRKFQTILNTIQTNSD
jgi:hypothetical protein